MERRIAMRGGSGPDSERCCGDFDNDVRGYMLERGVLPKNSEALGSYEDELSDREQIDAIFEMIREKIGRRKVLPGDIIEIINRCKLETRFVEAEIRWRPYSDDIGLQHGIYENKVIDVGDVTSKTVSRYRVWFEKQGKDWIISFCNLP